ncbi:MAG: hypothetical protein JRD92_17055 [Deltaproteobacteria bacterium]|nr:hypothetical protein [Deltaproteobacteria bacterium]
MSDSNDDVYVGGVGRPVARRHVRHEARDNHNPDPSTGPEPRADGHHPKRHEAGPRHSRLPDAQ